MFVSVPKPGPVLIMSLSHGVFNDLRLEVFVYFVDIGGIVDHHCLGLVKFMVFDATFNNISAVSWRSVLLVEETGVPRENHRPVASH